MTQPSMTCPKCGTDMNHQADKLVHPRTAEDAALVTAAFEGIIEVVFACPGCGWIDSYRGNAPART